MCKDTEFFETMIIFHQKIQFSTQKTKKKGIEEHKLLFNANYSIERISYQR